MFIKMLIDLGNLKQAHVLYEKILKHHRECFKHHWEVGNYEQADAHREKFLCWLEKTTEIKQDMNIIMKKIKGENNESA